MKVLFTIQMILFASWSISQTLNWSNTYGGQGYDEGFSAIELADSSYVVVGSSSSFYNSGQNILFMKVDSAGNFMHSNFIDNGLWEVGKKIVARNNGEFWICGHTNSFGNGGFDGYLVKVDSLGNKIEDFSFGGSDWEFFNDMIMLSDSSLIIVGETQSFGAGNKDAYILKVDKTGDTLWTRTVGTSKDDFAKAVTERNDTLYIAGQISDELSDSTFGLYLALDLNGNTLIQKRFGELENQYFNDIHQYSATDMYFVGAVYENNEKQAWFKIVGYQGNDNGGQYWQLAGGDTEVMATITYPGTFYLLNTFNSNTPGFSAYSPSYDFMVCKVSPGAWWTSAFIYGFTEDDYGNDLIPTQDLGALVIGSNADVQIGGRNLTLIKIGANDLYPPNDFDSIYPVTSSIEEYEIKELRFYPNPVSTNLYIQIDDFFKENYQYKIVSFSGQVLEESKLESQVIPTDFLSKGMYFIQVWSDKETYQSKFLKE